MDPPMNETPPSPVHDEIELADEDILDAMRQTHGYVDISSEDFRALYHLAYQHGVRRLHAQGLAQEQAQVPTPGQGMLSAAPVAAPPPATAHPRALGAPPRVEMAEVLWSGLGALVGTGALALVEGLWFAGTDLTLMLGSFGASAVLLFGVPRSPLAQPRNLVFGHIVSAAVGVAAYQGLHGIPYLAEGVAVGVSVSLMHLLRIVHPPGGGTALIAVTGSSLIHQMGWLFVFVPAILGSLVLLIIALAFNNLTGSRRYPEFW